MEIKSFNDFILSEASYDQKKFMAKFIDVADDALGSDYTAGSGKAEDMVKKVVDLVKQVDKKAYEFYEKNKGDKKLQKDLHSLFEACATKKRKVTEEDDEMDDEELDEASYRNISQLINDLDTMARGNSDFMPRDPKDKAKAMAFAKGAKAFVEKLKKEYKIPKV